MVEEGSTAPPSNRRTCYSLSSRWLCGPVWCLAKKRPSGGRSVAAEYRAGQVYGGVKGWKGRVLRGAWPGRLRKARAVWRYLSSSKRETAFARVRLPPAFSARISPRVCSEQQNLRVRKVLEVELHTQAKGAGARPEALG